MKTNLNVTENKDKLIDLICDFNIHESIEKEDLIELLKYQREKIREMRLKELKQYRR